MKSNIQTAFNREMECARATEETGDIANAKRHLERAHILGQRWYISHMKTHFHMLRLALRQSDAKETRGQITRLIGAGPFHIAGWVPIGNTGGADVSATLPMPVPSDLQSYFEGHSLRKGLIIRGVLLAAVVSTYMLFPK